MRQKWLHSRIASRVFKHIERWNWSSGACRSFRKIPARRDEASLLRLSRKGEEKSVIARILSIRLDSHIWNCCRLESIISELVRPGSLCNRNPWPSSLIRAGIRESVQEGKANREKRKRERSDLVIEAQKRERSNEQRAEGWKTE